MTVKELIEKLNAMPQDLPVVLCDLNDDGDGEGNVYLPEIHNVEQMDAVNTETHMGPGVDCVFINFKGRL